MSGQVLRARAAARTPIRASTVQPARQGKATRGATAVQRTPAIAEAAKVATGLDRREDRNDPADGCPPRRTPNPATAPSAAQWPDTNRYRSVARCLGRDLRRCGGSVPYV